ncbi:porin [Methylobacterium sp. BTF04]|uniref:porin n=1 Tax=Methylobacterium sp. BTF04 TaxID=2708300 RepID=UPI001FEF954E|nr:porin [Methylobacterium sp. BTF04]
MSGWSALAANAAEPVRPAQEAMRPCPKHGAGFVRIPGSATCIRLSGRVAAGIDLRGAHKAPSPIPPNLARLAIDTRTETDYGPVRTFVRTGSAHR